MAHRASTYKKAWKDLESRACDPQLVHEIEEKPKVELAALIQSRSLPSSYLDSEHLGKLQFLLQQLAAYPAVVGALQVRDGDVLGWQKIRMAFRRLGLSVKVSILDYVIQDQIAADARKREQAQRNVSESSITPRSTKEVLSSIRERGSKNVVSVPAVRSQLECDAFMVTLLQAVIFGEREMYEGLLRHLRESLRKSSIMVEFEEPLWLVVISLCFRWAFPSEECSFEKAIRPSKYRILPSEALLPMGCDSSLIAICDLGLSARRQGLSPLGIDPCEVFPIEIVAIERIRAALQLPAAQIAHPLLESPLRRVLDDISVPDDPVTFSVEKHLRNLLPNYDETWEA